MLVQLCPYRDYTSECHVDFINTIWLSLPNNPNNEYEEKKKKKQSILWCHDLNLIMSLSQRSKVRRNLQDKWPEFFQRLNGVKNRGKQKYSGWERTETIQPMQWVDLSLFRIKDQPHWKKKEAILKNSGKIWNSYLLW